MIRCRAVEGRCNDLALDYGTHIGHFFRALINQNNHEVNLGVVQLDCLGDLLDDHGLTGLRRRDNQATLPLTNGSNQINDARGISLSRGLHAQLLIGVDRGELGKLTTSLCILNAHTVDGVNANQRVVLLALTFSLTRLTDGACDRVTGAQSPTTDIAEGDINIVRTRQITRGAHESMVFLNVQDARDRCQIFFRGRSLRCSFTAFASFTAVATFATGFAAFSTTATTTPLAIATRALTGFRIVAIGERNFNVLAGCRFFLFTLSGGRKIQGDGRRLSRFTGDDAATATLTRKACFTRRTFFGSAFLHRGLGEFDTHLRGFAGLLTCRAATTRSGSFWTAALGSANCLDELGLAHGRNALEAQFSGHSFEFHQLQSRKFALLGGHIVAQLIILTCMAHSKAR